jgi:hypothetical protein
VSHPIPRLSSHPSSSQLISLPLQPPR